MRRVAARHIASKKVSQSTHERVIGASRAPGPRTSGSVEDELPRSPAMIKLIKVCVANLASKPKLVFPGRKGNDVRDVPRKVTPAFRRREPNLFKPARSARGRRGNHNVRSPINVLATFGRAGAEEQAHRLGV